MIRAGRGKDGRPRRPDPAKPDPGGFSYMIMKINVGMYPWNLVR